MADYTSQDIDRIIASLDKMTSASSRIQSPAAKRTATNDDKEFTSKKKELVKGLDNITGSLSKTDKELATLYRQTKDASANTIGLATNLKSMAAWTLAATTAISASVGVVKQSVDSFRELSNIGQTFGGSMLKMQMAAADAALPLEEFTKLLKQNSLVIAATGVKGFTDMGKSLRASLRDFDMLNLTTQNLNEYLGEYAETQRLYGHAANMSSYNSTESMKSLALETTKMSELTGKNRLEVLKHSQIAMRDNSMISRMMLMAGTNTEAFSRSTQKAVTYMAALPGEAGTTLSRMLAQTVGRGAAELTDDMQMFIDGGITGMGSLMNTLGQKIKNGNATEADLEAARQDFLAEAHRNYAGIKWNADMGNESAKKVVGIIAEMESLKGKKLQEWRENQQATSALMGFQETVSQLSGQIRTKLLISFEHVFKAVSKFTTTESFAKLAKNFSVLSDRIVAFFTRAVTEENLSAIGNGILMFIKGAMEVGSAISSIVSVIAKGMIKLQDAFGTIGAIVASVLLYQGGKKLAGAGARYAGNKAVDIYRRYKGTSEIGGGGLAGVRNVNGALAVYITNAGGAAGGLGAGDGGTGGSSNKGGRKRRGVMGKIADGAKSVGRAAWRNKGAIGKVGLAGAATYGASKLLEASPDFAGKGAVESGVNIAGLAGTGAMLGSMVMPGVGTAIGGILGGLTGTAIELYDNWDAITTASSDAMSSLGGGISAALSSVKNFDSTALKANMSSNIDSAISSVSGVMSNVNANVSSMFSWASNLVSTKDGSLFGDITSFARDTFKSTETALATAGSLLQGIPVMGGVASVLASNMSGVANKPSGGAANINTDMMAEQIKAMQANTARMERENSELRNTMAKVLEVLATNGHDLKAGMIEQIEEIRKGNRDIRNISQSGS